MIHDLRHGLRILLKSPGFTLVAVLTLALGIGSNTAIFSIVNSVLLKPLPYPHSEQIIQSLWQWRFGETPTLTSNQYRFWKENNHAFEAAAATGFSGSGFNLTDGAKPVRIQGLRVSDEFFKVLGIYPSMGRGFLPDEDRPGAPDVAVISNGLWRGYFGSAPDIIGKTVQINGANCAIVGVMPADFWYQQPLDVILPLRLVVDPADNGHNTMMLARLKPSVTLQQAEADAKSVFEQFRATYPQGIDSDRGFSMTAYQKAIIGDSSQLILLLFGAVGFVLLIACANLANLLLSRAAGRNGEMAVRIALGAGKLRLLRQLITENMILALVGCAAGIVVAGISLKALLQLMPTELPRSGGISLDANAVIFAVLVSVLTCLISAIAPALHAFRVDLNNMLKAASSRSGNLGAGGRMRQLLVSGEVALSLVLLIGAGLLVESFVNLHRVQSGFDPENVMTMQVSLDSAQYKTTEAVWNLEQKVNEELSRSPAVQSVASVPSLPMEVGLNTFASATTAHGEEGTSTECRNISYDYFKVLRIPILSGRTFNQSDTEKSVPVVIVNETLAKKYWPEGDVVGRLLQTTGANRQVVGIAKDVKEKELDLPPSPTVYIPMSQTPDKLTRAMGQWFMTSWMVRTNSPSEAAGEMRAALASADSSLPVAKVRPLIDVISASTAQQRFTAALMGVFAGLALLLTVVGLYGVLSFQVSQRKGEIGIRMALGASRKEVVLMIVRQGAMLALVGEIVGVAAALGLTRLMSDLVFGIGVRDTGTFILIPVCLSIVALLACFIPARAASRVDPMRALRYE